MQLAMSCTVFRCFHCSERGATLGCRVERCKASYHLPCARAVQATFYDAKYLIACPKHAPWFQNEQTPQQQYAPACSVLFVCAMHAIALYRNAVHQVTYLNNDNLSAHMYHV